MTAFNYFNYFTEIEEYFWQKRGAHLLVSPLDWAIVETWQKAGIPLSAVLKGIDRAFESYARSRRAAGGRQLKTLAYCADAVLEAATEEREAAAGTGPSVSRTKEGRNHFHVKICARTSCGMLSESRLPPLRCPQRNRRLPRIWKKPARESPVCRR
jgi:hypothetical protein